MVKNDVVNIEKIIKINKYHGKYDNKLKGYKMKMEDALKIICEREEPQGFMVVFERRNRGILTSDLFPDKHAKEPLIRTEKEAWELARKFAENKTCVNIYVVKEDFRPVKGYEKKILKKYP